MNKDTLQIQLDYYIQIALDMGMTDAKIIQASSVVIDPRVRLKCRYPRCGYYGTCGNCPPYTTGLDEILACVSKYHYGIFCMKRFPSGELLGVEKADKGTAKPGDTQRMMYDTVSKIEAAAFRDGHVLAMGFANGPCKKLYCSNTHCTAITPGGSCRFPLKSRSSMEGVGMNAFLMAKQVGWDVIPVGHSSTPEEVPYLTSLGLILIV